jgi:hypothetical protein
MPPTLTVTDVTTVTDYMGFVEASTEIRWYRGVGDESLELLPSLYRHPTIKDADLLAKQEQEILKRFQQRSGPYLRNPLREDDKNLSTLFLMQHFGVPTRLLDWTENPYLALFFALTDANYEKTPTGPKYTSDPAVWVLKPEEWNNKIFPYATPPGPPGIISPPNDDELNGYLPIARGPKEAVALLGIHNSPRIVAQKGVFTLFGSAVVSMDQAYIDSDFPQDCLVKLRIDKDLVSDLLGAMTRIGITDSVVFPELEGLAREIKREFKYWV